MVDCLHWAVFRKLGTEVTRNFRATFSTITVEYALMHWATFWAIFSQTHPVTLPRTAMQIDLATEPTKDKNALQ
jgi:hypothetical protein